jgi:hypothetical protein
MNRPRRRARLDDIADVASSLRNAPIQTPDFTSSILDRVDVQRPFLAPSVRRRLPWIRIGLGASVAFAALGIALTHRWAPEAVQLTEQPAPISDVVQSCAACGHLVALRPAVLKVTEQDASQFFAAVVTAARVAEDEGRRTTLPADSPTTVTALLPLSQAVPLDTPAPPTNAPIARATASRGALHLRGASLTTAQSVLPDSGGQAVLMSSDLPKVKVFPTFFEHDLDGLVLPR